MQSLEVTSTGLRATIKEGVAAADVSLQAVELANAVLQVDDMLFAGTPAVFVGGAFTEEDTEHAMLHVKHGHVLVESKFQPVAWRAVGKLKHLANVEVIGDGDLVELGLIFQELGGDGVGDVEGEIANLDQVAAILVVLERSEVTQQEPVGLGTFDEFQVAEFARFENTWRGE